MNCHPFSNTNHDLPPSFDHESDDFKCSVEYFLRAELYQNKALVEEYELPVMFLPFERSAQGNRASGLPFSNPNPFVDKASCKSRKDSVVEIWKESSIILGTEIPGEITIGRSFCFTISIQMPEDVDVQLAPTVCIPKLKLVNTIDCRSLQQLNANSNQQRQSQELVTLQTRPRMPLPSLDVQANQLRYVFEATMPSEYHPSFRSFLVSNTFRFQTPVMAEVSGSMAELPLDSVDIAVLSPVAQTAMRKVSSISTNCRLGGVGFGRALSY